MKPDRRVEDLLRELAPQVLGALTRRYGMFDLCEDAVQEALLAAALQWPGEGVPASPRSWLLTVAGRRLTDQARSDSSRRRRETAEPAGPAPAADDDRSADRDDSLTLLFLCCLLLTDARRATRVAADGTPVPLAEQDRGRWDAERIDEDSALVSAALTRAALGPYQLQAAIAAVHAEAPDPDGTDWAQILGLYALLESMTPNPMITLNRAVALAMVRGPAAGLRLLDTLDGDRRVAGSHRLAAVRAHLHELAGDRTAAREHYRTAARRTTSLPERRYLERRAAALGNPD